AISLLQKDHRTVEAIFDQLEELKGDGSTRKKEELCERLVRELSIHSAIEEMIFYPEVKKAVAAAKEIVLESLEEHNVIKWELDAIQASKIASTVRWSFWSSEMAFMRPPTRRRATHVPVSARDSAALTLGFGSASRRIRASGPPPRRRWPARR
ncbi:MAG TPA: hemerythrin domain-containing protein, partial [Polyangiaceae bacterium]|nr:hemerythrin domain-containing protein [Polyangiaceae bacterium]